MSNLYLDILQGRLRRPRPQIPNNLPHEMSSFIGRKSAISDIANRVRNSHLVTLTGVGGAGKTRLSLRVAEELLSEFPDGVWLIELAALSEPEHVITRMAQIFEIRELDERSLEEKIVQLLSNRQALLILDNCEHLISAAAELTQRLLLSSSDLKILATSRESLNISGEVIWPVPPLALDSDNSDAAQLFVERAQSSNPQFHVKQDEADTLLNICQQLDGIPLAIELAASQTRSLTLPQIAERLSNRFSLLGQKSRTALPHQQTLRATMDWSYQLLTEGEQSLLDRLSVFRGGFALEAAEYVCANGNLPSGEILPTLQGLIDKSLISVSRTALQTG